jgi:hypothetical protein
VPEQNDFAGRVSFASKLQPILMSRVLRHLNWLMSLPIAKTQMESTPKLRKSCKRFQHNAVNTPVDTQTNIAPHVATVNRKNTGLVKASLRRCSSLACSYWHAKLKHFS